MAAQHPGSEGKPYFATGISMVLHPKTLTFLHFMPIIAILKSVMKLMDCFGLVAGLI
ncbi:MAG: hypothetical protein R2865_05885 [Deinococcales bacterium]